MADLGHQQRIIGDFRKGHRLHFGYGMVRGRYGNQFISMDKDDSEPVVGDWKGDKYEIHAVVYDRFQNFGVIGALNIYGHVWILLFEVGEDLRKNVEAGAFIRADNDFSAGNAFGFRDGGKNRPARLKRVFNIFQKELAGSRE